MLSLLSTSSCYQEDGKKDARCDGDGTEKHLAVIMVSFFLHHRNSECFRRVEMIHSSNNTKYDNPVIVRYRYLLLEGCHTIYKVRHS